MDFTTKQRLNSVLSQNSKIILWSCESAKTELQCQKLQKTADSLSTIIVAKNSEVHSGPDVGSEFDDITSRIVAFFLKDIEANKWKQFTPRTATFPHNVKKGPDAKLLKVNRIK